MSNISINKFTILNLFCNSIDRVLGVILITDRINERVRQLKLKQTDIVVATKASPATVNKWLNHTNEPSAKYLEDLAKILNVSIEWLITGVEVADTFDFTKVKIRKAPILSFYEVVDFYKYLITNDEKRDFEYFVDNNFSDELFWVRTTTDNSMLPTFKDGDLILIDTKREPRTGNCVVAVVEGDTKATLRKYRICYDEKANKEYFQLVAENDFYPAIDSRRNRFSVKGVAVKHERTLV